ncbi:unnamed protein product [Brachionus calyciflorus]|uniref:Amino acid transporter transmembrane domain-containing protein n=1 Tax=Brachionus calyciflorus TaxID=104777 RepID=A0A813MAA2_9BILA|nr:unnamed protein product [Brachionus calyciflorus]
MTEGITLKNLVSMTNGVVGLSLLAMPYCFSQCGLILGTLTLLFCALMTSYSCKLIIRTIEIAKTNSFEYLAYKVFGHRGKLFIEICIILLLFGSLVTNQQALCDTGPVFFTKLLNLQNYPVPRFGFMVVFTVLISLPLSLSKRLEALHSLNTCAILFYFCFGLYLMWEASYKLVDYTWLEKIKLWEITGLLKCFPIFSVSFSCQTVLFVVYSELENKEIIDKLADSGILISFICYFLTGFFGYISYYDVTIYGNITYNIPDSFLSQFFLYGFIICVISGFPFIIYPCRTSLNTLFFSQSDELMDDEVYMPEHRFKNLTYILVFLTTSTAVLVPNLEFVLSLTGSTAGSLTAYVWPSMLYKFVKGRINFQREYLLNAFLFLGIVIFCICSVATFFEFKPTQENNEADSVVTEPPDSLAFYDNQGFDVQRIKARLEPAVPMEQMLEKFITVGKTIVPVPETIARNIFNEKTEEK